eukprot:TRINITY_DN8569_c0_g1_i1.p1 TRINITY_DN8569_c0_g1~~TRINITY_DN8569_c0_g1_i1.p1  ORF type:complete len:539 (-),score=159.50 TRINITY_DN8569_c0_g1_i1:36-1619(-)
MALALRDIYSSVRATIKDGCVMNAVGELTGYLNEDGSAGDLAEQFLGEIIDNNILNGDGVVLGRVDTINGVWIINDQPIGKILPDGTLATLANEKRGNFENYNSSLILAVTGYLFFFDKDFLRAFDPKVNELLEMQAETTIDVPDKILADPLGIEIGSIAANGSAILNSKLVGFINADGSAGNINEEFLGELNEVGNYIDAEDKVVGSIDPENNSIKDENGEVIAIYAANGYVSDKEGNVKIHISPFDINSDDLLLGSYVLFFGRDIFKIQAQTGIIVKSAYGAIRSIVAYDGTVRDKTGAITGFINDDGSAGNVDEEFLGEIVESTVIDPNGYILGKVDGSKILNDDDKHIATLEDDGTLVDNSGNFKGYFENYSPVSFPVAVGFIFFFDIDILAEDESFDPSGLVFLDNQSQIRAVISAEGEVSDANQVLHGYINTDGTAGNAEEEYLGEVQEDGTFINASGALVGFLVENRVLLNDNSLLVRIQETGEILNAFGTPIGNVQPFYPDSLKIAVSYLLFFDRFLGW